MKMKIAKSIAVMLSCILLLGMLPAAALAADDEFVITQIKHTDTDTVSLPTATDRDITFTVAYSYGSAAIDLSSNLDITTAADVEYAVSTWPSGSTVTIADYGTTPTAIPMTVTYKITGEEETTTTYYICIVRAERTAPTFSGTIAKTVTDTVPQTITFLSTDFTDLYTANDGSAIDSITITGTDPSFGTLIYNGSDALGVTIPITNIANLTFEATDAGTVQYIVKATAGTDVDIGSVIISITVTAITEPTIDSAVTASVIAGNAYYFTADDFLDCCDLNNGTVTGFSLSITSSTYGTWTAGSYNQLPSGSNDIYYTAGSSAGTDTFTWTITNEAGTATTGTGAITVNTAGDPAITGSVTETIGTTTTYVFTTADFSSNYDLNYGTLDTITITPTNTGYGTWYLNGTVFTAATDVSAAELNSGLLKFVSSGTVGTASFSWTVATAESANPASGTGTITVSTVSSLSSTATAGATKVFAASTIASVCSSATSGQTLSYITFTVPSTGTLYAGYTSASSPGTAITSSSTQYTASGNFAYVPASSTTGTVTITYKGYTSDGSTFTGYNIITYSSSLNVSYTTSTNTAVAFSSSDFYSSFYSSTGTTLSYVKFTLPSYSYGTLYQYYSTYGTTYPVSSSTVCYYSSYSPLISDITFVPYTGYTGTVTIYFTAYSTSGTAYTGTVKITVGGSNTISYSTDEDTAVTFSASDFNSVCYSKTGYYLSYVKFTLPSSYYGTLYYSTSSSSTYNAAVTSSTKLYRSSIPYLNYVTFVPYSGYSGTVTLTYKGYSTDGTYYTGYVTITVDDDSNTISYSTDENTAVTFSASDFNSVCYSETGYYLNYVKFTLPSSYYGTLYYSTSSSSTYNAAVTSSTKLYRSSIPYLNYVTFVPYSGYSGTVTLTYKGYSTDGTYYTGYVTITVDDDSNTISYSTDENTAVTFSASDFNSVCYSETGYYLNYVKFTLPSSYYGTLYYSTSSSSTYNAAVTSSTKLYRSSIPYLNYVTFVPYSGYSGTVTLTYKGYSTAGTSYTGYVTITVGDDSNTISYSTDEDTAVTFSASDFNSVCYSQTGYYLNYVKFTLPSSYYGTLYYSTSSSSTYNAAVTSSTKLYRSSIPYLNYVTFVPSSGYSGTVTLTYKGYSTAGTSYTGYVTITVTDTVSSISYSTDEDTAITFSASDFNSVCYSATGYYLSYVKFTLPSSYYGTLYYSTSSSSTYNASVTSSTKLYKSSIPYLNYVTFVPYSGYSGTVTITYTGYATNGTSFTGEIVITINASDGSSYFDDVDSTYSWASTAIDCLYEKGIVNGTGADTYSPGSYITRGDFILMLYRALGFNGTPSSMFSDVAEDSYYYEAIAAAKALGIAEGSGSEFNPDDPITRQDAMVLIYRALEAMGYTLDTGSTSDLASYDDSNQISSYAKTAVATLVNEGIIKGSGTLIKPFGYLTRAEMAVVIYRII